MSRVSDRAPEASAVLAAQIEASPDGILVVTPQGEWVSYNKRFLDIWRLPDAVVATGDDAAARAAAQSRLVDPDAFARIIERLEAHPAETLQDELILTDGRTLERYSAPWISDSGEIRGRIWFFRDITGRKRGETLLRRTARALSTLSEANMALVRATSEEGLYQRMCDILVSTGGYRMAWIGVPQDDESRSVLPVACAGHEAGYLQTLDLTWADAERGRGPFGRAVREGVTQINDATADTHGMGPWREAALARGYQASIGLPLKHSGRVFGVLSIYAAEAHAFGPEETSLLEELATDLAFGLVTLRDRQARERLAAIVDDSRDAILSKTLEGIITSWNRGAAATYGYSAEEAIGQSVELIIPPERRDELTFILDQVRKGERLEMVETERVRKDGERITIQLVVSPLRDYEGRVVGASAIGRDITDQKRIERDLMRAAHYDSLTGLPNRGAFVEALRQAIAGGRRWGRQFAVLFMDLDHFKDVNDTMGHPAGDRLLKAVARRLEATVRETDTVSRFGGDEFAIICRDPADAASVAAFSQRLLDAVNQPIEIDGTLISSGASLGIAVYGADTVDAETMLSCADIALYRAKGAGRGTYRFFTEAMEQDVRRRVSLGTSLRAAIEADGLFLLYQPQVDALDGRLIGLEALVRWRHPVRGVISPSDFIPVAEQLGVARPLGRWVAGEACRQLRAWRDAGLEPPPIGINISALQFRTSGELEDDLMAVAEQHGLSPACLELELTETVLMEASREHAATLGRLRDAGFGLAIDDFGTGYSSLDYLRRFPADRIKIDRTFVCELEDDPGAEAIVRAIIGMSGALGVRVIAEGVETRRQRDLLLGWGCREMQGFHFARPLPAAAAFDLLAHPRPLPMEPVAAEA